ncbi:hypothetical protein KHA80_19765 [Anaerobacillus sp. HL2]|nr:hypothetical protein KHA80_19765 [Anaerobacillus sp. HL2]
MNAINFLKMANMQQMQSKMNFSREKSEEWWQHIFIAIRASHDRKAS